MDMAATAAAAVVHPRAASQSHSCFCNPLPCLASGLQSQHCMSLSAAAMSPASSSSCSSSCSSFCSYWDEARVQIVGKKKSGREFTSAATRIAASHYSLGSSSGWELVADWRECHSSRGVSSRSSSVFWRSYWRWQQQQRDRRRQKKTYVSSSSSPPRVGDGVSNLAIDAEKPILYENGDEPPTVVSAPNRRIVAIGDLHGDLERTLWALQLAGVLSKDGLHRWTGGTTVLVQVGDVLDRGDDEIAILSLLACLRRQACIKGGAVFQINGNHETMNVAGDFRHVTPGGFQEAEAFVDCCEEDHGGNWEAAFGEWYATSQERKADQRFSFGGWLPIFNPLRMQKGAAARSLLFEAGGPVAKELAHHGVALKVNDWLFAHGGIMPHHVEYGLERINHELSNWMKHVNNRWGQPTEIPFIAIKGFDSIVWSRLYSHETFENTEDKIQACALLSAALVAANAQGLVVGHTPQIGGANCTCDGRVWRIDVGMSSGVLHALPEVLEITDTKVRVLRMAEEFLQQDDAVEGWYNSLDQQRVI